jgi:hypothetical protein
LGRVTGVVPRQAASSLEGFCIDNPVSGDQLTGYEALIRGWVVGNRSRVTGVQLFDPSLQSVFREAPQNEPRPDVAAHYPHAENAEQSGFRIPFSLLNLQPEASVEVVAVLEDGSRVLLGTVSFRRDVLASGYAPRIQPLMVSCLGRSGSTYLMAILKNHPQVVVHGDAPFESRLCKYYIHNLLKTLSEPPETLVTAFRDETYAVNAHWLSAELPLDPQQHHRFRRQHVERLAEFCLREIDEVYTSVCREQRPAQPGPRFYAEKHGAGHTPRLLWELYPQAREIVMVRDFRDMFCSALAFNRQRGTEDFGMGSTRTDEEFLEVTRERVMGLVSSMRSRSQDVFVMKYEDLVTSPAATVSAALEYAGIARDRELVEGILAQARAVGDDAHRTSISAACSIGRWQQDLPAALRRNCDRAFSEALEVFGYR